MRVAMAAQHEGRHVFDADFQFLGEEMAEARAVEHARHADDLVMRQAGELTQRPHHGVERVGDADDEGVRRVLLDAFAHRRHDLQIDAQKIVAAHAGLARHAGRDDDNIGAGDIGVGIRALEVRVIAFDGAGLGDVEALALRQALHDVEQDDIPQFLEADQMGERAADLSAADERDFLAGHGGSCALGGPLS